MEPSPLPAGDGDVERLLASGLGALGSIFVAAALVPVRGVLATRDVAIVLVGVVAAAAVAGGAVAGVVTTATSTLSLAFFHARPYLSLKVAAPTDRSSALVFVLVGLLVAATVPRLRRALPGPSPRRAEVRSLHRVSSLLAAGQEADDVILAAQAELAALLGLEECRFEPRPYLSLLVLPRLERTGVVVVDEHRFGRGGLELPRTGVELPVLARGREVGHFVLTPRPGQGVSPDARVAALGLADLVGAALAAGRAAG